jgi:hypothetical protein
MAYRTFVQRNNDRERLQDELISRLNDKEDELEDMEEDGFIAPESDVDSDEEKEDEICPSTGLPVYSLEDIQNGIGYLMPVAFKNGNKNKDPVRTLVPKVAMYANRGFDLRELNLMEYVALIDMRERVTTASTKCKHFDFPPSFICAAEYDQMLCMKQKTVIVIGKSPRHPGDRPRRLCGRSSERWKREADEYARFYLTLYRPEVLCYEINQENNYKYDWDALNDFVESLSRDKTILSKFRLMSMHTRMKGLYTTSDNKMFSSTYCNRSRDLWDPTTRRLVALDKSFRDMKVKNRAKYYERAENKYTHLSDKEIRNMSKVLSNSMDLVSAMESLCSPGPDWNIVEGRRRSEVQVLHVCP